MVALESLAGVLSGLELEVIKRVTVPPVKVARSDYELPAARISVPLGEQLGQEHPRASWQHLLSAMLLLAIAPTIIETSSQ